ncbi:hypothetical protein E2C01_050303 [Portunus trituberculatus]|uniref:Uncharacterized protein n=1 Tax=Portunus trituberculatus TaxID=210409 RepID=A0A5B7GFJ1_PORTR|nr:hypothetical protein [Portunus trituberculatus]
MCKKQTDVINSRCKNLDRVDTLKSLFDEILFTNCLKLLVTRSHSGPPGACARVVALPAGAVPCCAWCCTKSYSPDLYLINVYYACSPEKKNCNNIPLYTAAGDGCEHLQCSHRCADVSGQ